MSGNGDELDPREGGLEGGIDGGIDDLQQQREREQLQRDAAQQAGEDISPEDIAIAETDDGVFEADLTEEALQRERDKQREQLREQAIAEIEGLSDPSLIEVVKDGDQFRAELSEEGGAQLENQQREQLREDALEQVEGVDDPSAVEIVKDGDTLEAQLTEAAQIDAAIAERESITEAESVPEVEEVERLSIDEAEELMENYPVPPQREIVTSLQDVNLSELPESTAEDIVSALASGEEADIGLSPTGRTVDREDGPLSASEQSQRVIVRPDEDAALVTASEEEAVIASEFGAESVAIADELSTDDRNVLDDFRSDTSPGTIDSGAGSASSPIAERETTAAIPDGRTPDNLQRAGRIEGGLEGLRFDAEGRSIIEGTPDEQGIEGGTGERGTDAAQLEEQFTEETGLADEDVRVVEDFEGDLVAAPTEQFEERAEREAADIVDSLDADAVEATVGPDFETEFDADTTAVRDEIAAETPGLDAEQVDAEFTRGDDGDLQFEQAVTEEGQRDIIEARAEEQLEERFGEEFDDADIMVSETDDGFAARLAGGAGVEQATESAIEANREVAGDGALEALAARLDEQVDADVTADDIAPQQTGDGDISYGLSEEFQREQAREQVAQQIQEANPDADSIVARRAFSGLEAGEDFEISVGDDGSVSAELTPEGRETVTRTIARTENPDADNEFVREEFSGELEFDDEGQLANVEADEQFGDSPLGDDALRAAGDFLSESVIDPTAEFIGDVSGAPLQAAEFLPGETATEETLVDVGEEQERLTEEFVSSGLEIANVPNTTAGLIEGGEFIGAGLERSAVGDAVEGTPLVEGPADQGEDLDEFLDRAGDEAADLGQSAVTSAQDDPLGATVTLGGSLAGSIGVIGAASRVSGTAGRAGAVAIQPGEEIASAGASRLLGSTSRGSRILQTLPNNRVDPENIALSGVERAGAAVRARIPDGDLARSLRAGPDRSFLADTRAQQTITRTREAEAESETETESGQGITEEEILRQQEQQARDNLPPREAFESAEAYAEAFERRVRRLRGEDPFETEMAPEAEAESEVGRTQEQSATTAPAPEGRAAELGDDLTGTPAEAETDIERAVEGDLLEGEAAGQVDTVSATETAQIEDQLAAVDLDSPTAEQFDEPVDELVDQRTGLDDELRFEQPTDLREELETEQRLREETELETELRTELETEQRLQTETRIDTEFESEPGSEAEPFDENDPDDGEDGIFVGDDGAEEQFEFDVADPDDLVGGDEL